MKNAYITYEVLYRWNMYHMTILYVEYAQIVHGDSVILRQEILLWNFGLRFPLQISGHIPGGHFFMPIDLVEWSRSRYWLYINSSN